MKKLYLFAILAMVVPMAFAFPNNLNTEGILRNAADNSLLSGSYAFNLSIINRTGRNVLYSSEQQGNVYDGVFDMLWKNIDAEYFSDDLSYTMMINNRTFSEQNISAEPYAFFAHTANRSIYIDTNENAVINADLDVVGNFSVDSPTFFVDSTANRVGIGTTSPEDILEIAGSNVDLRFNNSASSASEWEIKPYIAGVNNNGFSIRQIADRAGAANDRFVIDGTGNVGIGTSSPSKKLEIKSSGNSDVLRVLNTDGNSIFEISEISDHGFLGIKNNGTRKVLLHSEGSSYFIGGNVGIGTTAPQTKLHVQGNATFNLTTVGEDFNIQNASGSSWLLVDNTNGNVGIGTTSPAHKLEVAGSMNVSGGLNVSKNVIISGNVGVGTTSPGALFHVAGSSIQSSLFNGRAGEQIYVSQQSTTNTNTTGIIGYDQTGTTTFTLSNQFKSASAAITFNVNQGERMRIIGSGNVGIGTTAPTSKLEINGSDSALLVRNVSGETALFVNATSGRVGIGTTAPRYLLSVADTTGDGLSMNVSDVLYVNGSSGRVGIGTQSPNEFVEIRKDQNAATTLLLTNSQVAGNTARTMLKMQTDSNNGIVGVASASYASVADWADSMFFNANAAAAYRWAFNSGTVMTLDSNGNLGIGTTSPTTKLQVNGTIAPTNNMTGDLGTPTLFFNNSYIVTAHMGDVQEFYIHNDSYNYEIGTVVGIDYDSETAEIKPVEDFKDSIIGVVGALPYTYLEQECNYTLKETCWNETTYEEQENETIEINTTICENNSIIDSCWNNSHDIQMSIVLYGKFDIVKVKGHIRKGDYLVSAEEEGIASSMYNRTHPLLNQTYTSWKKYNLLAKSMYTLGIAIESYDDEQIGTIKAIIGK